MGGRLDVDCSTSREACEAPSRSIRVECHRQILSRTATCVKRPTELVTVRSGQTERRRCVHFKTSGPTEKVEPTLSVERDVGQKRRGTGLDAIGNVGDPLYAVDIL